MNVYTFDYLLESPREFNASQEFVLKEESDKEIIFRQNKIDEIAKMLCLDPKETDEKGFYGRACSRLINKNKKLSIKSTESRELLLSFIRQDHNRGYPTAKEWNNLITEVKEFLSKYPEN